MKSIMTNISRVLMLAGAGMAFVTQADDKIQISNETDHPYWVGIFYTKDKHTKIYSNEDGSVPQIFRLYPHGYRNLERLPKRVGYDRDIVAFKKEPSESSSFGKKAGPAKTTIPIRDAFYLNVGTLQFVDTVDITDSGLKKTG